MKFQPAEQATTPLDRAEYVEQEYFFRILRERTQENVPIQEALSQIREEILATTNLPLAIDYLRAESLHGGRLNAAMHRIPHYFTPFQTFIVEHAESDTSRFDMAVALTVLERLAGFLANQPSPAGLFVYQFECVSRNRLGYDQGLSAIARDPYFNADWAEWIRRLSGRLGAADLADLIYFRSEDHRFRVRQRLRQPDWRPDYPLLFGQAEGRIARASRGKDPLYMFAALQRQLGYPRVPRAQGRPDDKLPPAVEARLQRMEKRITLLEAETKGTGIDLSEFIRRDDPNPPDQSPTSE